MKQIVSHFMALFDVQNVNWSQQMTIVKRLLKSYTKEQIIFALDYYASKGVKMYSLGYLSKTMDTPVREYIAQQNIMQQVGDASERNRRKLRESNEALSREKRYLDLFEEPIEDN